MSGSTAPQTRFWVAVEEVAVVVDTKETILIMIARRGMIAVVAVDVADVVDFAVVVVVVVTRVIGRAITLMIIVRGRLVRDVVWQSYGKDAMIRI